MCGVLEFFLEYDSHERVLCIPSLVSEYLNPFSVFSMFLKVL